MVESTFIGSGSNIPPSAWTKWVAGELDARSPAWTVRLRDPIAEVGLNRFPVDRGYRWSIYRWGGP
jgi:hypothetical protein